MTVPSCTRWWTNCTRGTCKYKYKDSPPTSRPSSLSHFSLFPPHNWELYINHLYKESGQVRSAYGGLVGRYKMTHTRAGCAVAAVWHRFSFAHRHFNFITRSWWWSPRFFGVSSPDSLSLSKKHEGMPSTALARWGEERQGEKRD